MTGIKFDIDRLREVMGYANEMSRGWKRVLEFNKTRPSLFNALTDGTIYLGVANSFRGAPEGGRYFTNLVEEMAYKACSRHRHDDRREVSAVFRRSALLPHFPEIQRTFYRMGWHVRPFHLPLVRSGGANLGFEYDLTRPLESLGRRRADQRPQRDGQHVLPGSRDPRNDRPVPSGRRGLPPHQELPHSTPAGMADNRRSLMASRDIPSLFIESDMMDRRVVSEAQMKNRIDAFFEGLASRRQQETAAR